VGSRTAIAVFARSEQSPTKVPFQPFDNKVVVVLDKEAPDKLALRLACCWARWIARRTWRRPPTTSTSAASQG
jgi:hypothetical protein